MNVRDQLNWYVEHPEELEKAQQDAAVIGQNDCLKEMRGQASHMVNWGQLEAWAMYELETHATSLKDTIIPSLRSSVRAEMSAANVKESIDRVDDSMKLRPLYQDAVKRRDRLQLIVNLCKGATVAFAQREKLLVSINARESKELESYPRL